MRATWLILGVLSLAACGESARADNEARLFLDRFDAAKRDAENEAEASRALDALRAMRPREESLRHVYTPCVAMLERIAEAETMQGELDAVTSLLEARVATGEPMTPEERRQADEALARSQRVATLLEEARTHERTCTPRVTDLRHRLASR